MTRIKELLGSATEAQFDVSDPENSDLVEAIRPIRTRFELAQRGVKVKNWAMGGPVTIRWDSNPRHVE